MVRIRHKKAAALLLLAAAAVGIVGLLLYNGVFWFVNPSRADYPVRGVDVSEYQGQIDWDVLSAQGLSFAFIKATEGSTYRDPCFQDNWEQAGRTELAVGAYHFFSYDSDGKTQAANFIAAVPADGASLPPVVDIEFYGAYRKAPAAKEAVQPMLDALLDELERHYRRRPILYATMDAYRLYLQGGYGEYPIWIRSVLSRPELPDGREWTFWQYSPRGKLYGYRGTEPYIDLNVFNGTRQAFEAFAGLNGAHE